MKKKAKTPFIPPERHGTVRQSIISLLENSTLSARDISADVRIREKDVASHLEHIHKTVSTTGRELVVTPAECTKCGFAFSKRKKLKKPNRCPVCKGESIRDPLFSIR